MRYGGSFAPPLSDELLGSYAAMIAALPARSPVRDAMQKLLTCCQAWWELPESSGTESRAHPSGLGTIVDLEAEHQAALWDHIPWSGQALEDGTVAPDELGAYAKMFDGIDPRADKPLRDAAHHLLWHVVELARDREPLTTDKL